jgi:hypothetical protein
MEGRREDLIWYSVQLGGRCGPSVMSVGDGTETLDACDAAGRLR